MLATEQRANINCCVLLHKYPSEALQMLEEKYGKMDIKKLQVYEGQRRFHDSRTVEDHQHRQLTKTLNVPPRYEKRLTEDISRSRNISISWKQALTSQTSGGRSVGIVRSQTEAKEFSLV
jgi:hypothetical protein